MTSAWYENENVKNRLVIFGRAIQGVAPYEVIIEPDRAKCRGGSCSFDRRRITVNPNIFEVPDAEQYRLTKGLLVHEAGHRRHTIPTALPPLIREVSNILEDERVERLMCQEFVGVRWLLARLSERFYTETKPVDENSDSSDEVILYFLQLRWATRIGKPIKGGLSARNRLLWEQVEPLVYEAWEAQTSEIADRNAAEIVGVLGVPELRIGISTN
jgi:hypothetical protein